MNPIQKFNDLSPHQRDNIRVVSSIASLTLALGGVGFALWMSSRKKRRVREIRDKIVAARSSDELDAIEKEIFGAYDKGGIGVAEGNYLLTMVDKRRGALLTETRKYRLAGSY